MVRDTSIQAYAFVHFTEQQEAILSVMREDPEREWAIADMARHLGWDKSTVSGRFNELKGLKVVEETEKKPSLSTGITSLHVKLRVQDSLW